MIRADPVTGNVPNRKQKVNEPKIYQSSISYKKVAVKNYGCFR